MTEYKVCSLCGDITGEKAKCHWKTKRHKNAEKLLDEKVMREIKNSRNSIKENKNDAPHTKGLKPEGVESKNIKGI